MAICNIYSSIAAIVAAVCVAGCAGTAGSPESVKQILKDKYLGKEINQVVTDLGAPESITKLDTGSKVYTWKRTSSKYQSNVFIKSDERCVITMLSDKSGKRIETVGTVDDSLGAYEISYCIEQYGL